MNEEERMEEGGEHGKEGEREVASEEGANGGGERERE